MPTIPTWRGVLEAEKDEGFRSHVQDVTRRVLRALGFLGPAAVVLYVLLHVARGRALTTAWGTHGIVIWDKLVILLVTAALVPLAGTKAGRRCGRWIAVGFAVIAAVASVLDDAIGGNAAFSSAWVSLFLVVTASALPLKPRQVATLAGAMILALLVPMAAIGGDVWGEATGQVVFLVSIAVCMSAVSLLLYRSRLVQYLATEKAVRMSAELADRADRIEKLEQGKSRFFAGITHDLRTPLSLVLGPVTDVLEHHEDRLDESVSAPLVIARRNAERLRRLVDDLLDISQLEAERLHLHPRPRDLVRLVDLWVLDLQPLAERAGVTLRLHAPTDAGSVVSRVDPDRMAQVVQNLVSNAISHTPRGGRVDVTLHPVMDGRTRIDVSDTGPGIPADVLPNVFDRFFQASSGVARSGRGLGLAIAKELTELHHGTISVASEPGRGSTFTIELQASADTSEEWIEEHRTPALPLPAPANGDEDEAETAELPLVLVVDDNDDMRRYLRMHLDEYYRVAEAGSAEEALELIEARTPDLVLVDVVMPGMDGFEFCRRIRAGSSTATMPVVLLTAQDGTDSLVSGMASGADDYLVKPFDPEALVARLENLIELRRILAPPKRLRPTEVLVKSADEEFVEQCRAVIEEHIGDSNFGVDWLADEVGKAPRTLQRKLRAATRLSAAGFIRMIRLGRAAQYLESGAKNVSETAYAVGFQDVDHFTRIFRQTFGVTPSEYARRGAPKDQDDQGDAPPRSDPDES